jgi:hypothetical protein
MSRWMETYCHTEKTPENEAWACTGCGKRDFNSHHDGPKNGVCECSHPVSMHIPSDDGWEVYNEKFMMKKVGARTIYRLRKKDG